MGLGLILLIVLVVVLIASLPSWGYHQAGWGPSGILAVVLVIILILVFTGTLQFDGFSANAP